MFGLMAAQAQDYRRPVPKTGKALPAALHTAKAAADTVFAPDSVTVAGFEKPLRAVRESMFVTNRTGRDIAGLAVDIVYLDMQGRMLHKATHRIDVSIPAGETRRVEITSFDRQGLFYYHLSPLPQRATRATPFKVNVSVKYVCVPA